MQVYDNVLLSTILWYQIGGIARIVIDVTSKEDVYEALKYIQENHIKNVFVLGLGSNMLFSDTGFDGAIIRFLSQEDGLGVRVLEGNIIESFSGEFLDSVIQMQFEAGLTGLEWAGGLPGTIGAAVRGNVGAFGGEIKDVFLKAHGIRLKDNMEYEQWSMDREEMEFSYRNSKVKKEKGERIRFNTSRLSQQKYCQIIFK